MKINLLYNSKLYPRTLKKNKNLFFLYYYYYLIRKYLNISFNKLICKRSQERTENKNIIYIINLNRFSRSQMR